MNRSEVSGNSGFFIFAAVSIIVAAAVFTTALGPLQSYAHDRAESQSKLAESSPNTVQAIGRMRLASALAPFEPRYRIKLADLYLKNGDTEQAVGVYGKTIGERERKATVLVQLGRYDEAESILEGINSTSTRIVRSKIALEQGRGGAAERAVADDPSEAANNQQELAKEYNRADSANALSVAQKMYAQGLYRATETLLERKADDSAGKYILLAHAKLKRFPADLPGAKMAAEKGIALDPSSIALHELLRDIAIKQGDKNLAEKERRTIEKLRAGKI